MSFRPCAREAKPGDTLQFTAPKVRIWHTETEAHGQRTSALHSQKSFSKVSRVVSRKDPQTV